MLLLKKYREKWYKLTIVGGWTNPFEKYDRQNGFIFPNFRGENTFIFETNTQLRNNFRYLAAHEAKSHSGEVQQARHFL